MCQYVCSPRLDLVTGDTALRRAMLTARGLRVCPMRVPEFHLARHNEERMR